MKVKLSLTVYDLSSGTIFFLSSGGVGPILFPASGVYDIPGVVFILTNVAVQAPHPRPASYATVAAQALPVSWLLPPSRGYTGYPRSVTSRYPRSLSRNNPKVVGTICFFRFF